MKTATIHEIHLDRPARNALDEETIDWIGARLDEAGGRAVLFTGTRDAFCAGLNLKRVAELEGPAMETFLRTVDGLFQRLFEYPAPVAAAIEGHAIAGGCVLAQACDYRAAIDDESVRIGVNEVALGACFPPSVLRLMRFRVPRRNLHRVMLGGELFTPRKALGLGLIDEVSTDPRGDALAWLERAASHPPATYALTKAALRADVAEPLPEDERRFREEEIPLWSSEELRERVRAALSK